MATIKQTVDTVIIFRILKKRYAYLWAKYSLEEKQDPEQRKEFKEKLNIAKMEVMRISPVLGVHTGPGIVGAAVVPMELMEDLS